jgi:hypothetical protein
MCRVLIKLTSKLISHYKSLAEITGSAAMTETQAALGHISDTLTPFADNISVYLQTAVLKARIWLVNPPQDEESKKQYRALVQKTRAMHLPVSISRDILEQLAGRAHSTPSLSHFAVELVWAWFLQNPLNVTVDALTTSLHSCFALHDMVNCEYTLSVLHGF